MNEKSPITAFKVLKREGDLLKSSSATHCALTYKEGEWTRPVIEHSKIFVFEEEEAAREFVLAYREDGILEVWRVEAEDLAEIKYLTYCTEEIESVKSVWELVHLNSPKLAENFFLLPPFGTKGASAIRLIEKIPLINSVIEGVSALVEKTQNNETNNNL